MIRGFERQIPPPLCAKSGSPSQGFVYLLEASTNLVDWEKVGVATDYGSGDFEVEDLPAPQLPARFYRLIVP